MGSWRDYHGRLRDMYNLREASNAKTYHFSTIWIKQIASWMSHNLLSNCPGEEMKCIVHLFWRSMFFIFEVVVKKFYQELLIRYHFSSILPAI